MAQTPSRVGLRLDTSILVVRGFGMASLPELWLSPKPGKRETLQEQEAHRREKAAHVWAEQLRGRQQSLRFALKQAGFAAWREPHLRGPYRARVPVRWQWAFDMKLVQIDREKKQREAMVGWPPEEIVRRKMAALDEERRRLDMVEQQRQRLFFVMTERAKTSRRGLPLSRSEEAKLDQWWANQPHPRATVEERKQIETTLGVVRAEKKVRIR